MRNIIHYLFHKDQKDQEVYYTDKDGKSRKGVIKGSALVKGFFIRVLHVLDDGTIIENGKERTDSSDDTK